MKNDQGIGPFDLGDRLSNAVFDARRAGPGQEVDQDLGVAPGTKNGPLAFEVFSDFCGIHQGAVVSDGKCAPSGLNRDGLGGLDAGSADGGVAHMADAVAARQALKGPLGEDVCDQALRAVLEGPVGRIVVGDDARGLLPAMLKGVQAQVGQLCCLWMPKDAKDPAHFAPGVACLASEVKRPFACASGKRAVFVGGAGSHCRLLRWPRIRMVPVACPDSMPNVPSQLPGSEETFAGGLEDRFVHRARMLFVGRMLLLGFGLGVLASPAWSKLLGVTSVRAFFVYFVMIAMAVVAYFLLERPAWVRSWTLLSLVFDLLVLVLVVQRTGGLSSPLMALHGLWTLFFVLLFPTVWSLVLPALSLVIIAKWGSATVGPVWRDETLFLSCWYGLLAILVAYLLLTLTARDERRTHQLRILSKAQELAIVSEERLRLAREIHDGLGGALSTLMIQSEFIERLATEPKLRQEITELRDQAGEAMDELRRSLTMMRRDFDLHKALEDYCRRFQDRTRVSCRLEVRGHPTRLPSEMQLAIFRLLQECLTNAQKHAEAATVLVQLRYETDQVWLKVRDDGKGFSVTEVSAGHYGLSNMVARAKTFRGTVEVESTPGEGTSVAVRLMVPLEGSHVKPHPGGPRVS